MFISHQRGIGALCSVSDASLIYSIEVRNCLAVMSQTTFHSASWRAFIQRPVPPAHIIISMAQTSLWMMARLLKMTPPLPAGCQQFHCESQKRKFLLHVLPRLQQLATFV